VSIGDINGVRFVIDMDSELCLLDKEWAALYLPRFSAGYKIIAATSPFSFQMKRANFTCLKQN
jgi:hypothetical protein